MHGFNSVRKTIEKNFSQVSKIMAHYGIEMTKELADMDYEAMIRPSSDDEAIMSVLERRRPSTRKLRLVAR